MYNKLLSFWKTFSVVCLLCPFHILTKSKNKIGPMKKIWNKIIYHLTISMVCKSAFLALVIIKTQSNIELYWWKIGSPNGKYSKYKWTVLYRCSKNITYKQTEKMNTKVPLSLRTNTISSMFCLFPANIIHLCLTFVSFIEPWYSSSSTSGSL